MSFFSKKLKKRKPTQIITTGLQVDELIKGDILKDLREKFGKDERLYVSAIVFRLVSQKDKRVANIVLEHPSPQHFDKKITVVTSNIAKILEKFIK